MSARAEFARYVRGLAAEFIEADGPADSAALRDALINNTNHLLDESTQVLITTEGDDPSWTLDAGDVGSTDFHLLEQVPDWVFPLTVRSDGTSARVVVHLRGRISGGGPGTATYRVRLIAADSPASSIAPPAPSSLITYVDEVSTTSTTGEDLVCDPIYLSAPTIAPRWPGLDAAGRTTLVPMAWVKLQVWAKGSSASAVPVLIGITAREYIG